MAGGKAQKAIAADKEGLVDVLTVIEAPSPAVLIEQLEQAFKQGDIVKTALLCWHLLSLEPGSGVAKIYLKKLMRDPEVAQLNRATIKKMGRDSDVEERWEDLCGLAAIGLLKEPADRFYTLMMAQGASSMERTDLIDAALSRFPDPAPDDIDMLNAKAAWAHDKGNYEQAAEYFRALIKVRPDLVGLKLNLATSLAGAGSYEAAIEMLETNLPDAEEPKEYLRLLAPLYRRIGENSKAKLEALDKKLFAKMDTAGRARAHSTVRLFLQDLIGAREGVRGALEFDDKPTARFELAELELATGDYQAGFKNYESRFTAFEYLHWIKPRAPEYTGQILKDERLFIWAEQGIGDEVLFAFTLFELAKRVRHVTMAADPRLIPYWRHHFPHWTFLNRHELKEAPPCDYAAPNGALMPLFLDALKAAPDTIKHPLLVPNSARLAVVKELLGERKKPLIGVCWRGGAGVNGKVRSLSLDKLMSGLPDEADVMLTSLQYSGSPGEEIKTLGDSRLALSGLNNRDDLDGVFALLSCCDAVLTIDNAVAHFACALGKPVHILIPAGQAQFRWKNAELRELFFPTAQLHIQDDAGAWDAPVARAWQAILGNMEDIKRA